MGAREEVMGAIGLLRVASSEDPDVRALCVRTLCAELDDRYQRMTSAVPDPLRERDLASEGVTAQVYAHPGTDLVTVELTTDALDQLTREGAGSDDGYQVSYDEGHEDGYDEGLSDGKSQGYAEALADVAKLAPAAA